jgi:hypothetical protein
MKLSGLAGMLEVENGVVRDFGFQLVEEAWFRLFQL